ncbi:MAG: D-alanyl-D-alanine carboxypeptidase [Clostridiaceae bacterium]|nr:D-alanyl-D-alanine carboxypeptidase [Clostridiaceae bacterium]
MRRFKFLSIIISLILLTSQITFFQRVKAEGLNVSARSAVALDCDSKLVLFEKNSEMIVSIASTTKIMTVMVAMKYGNLDKKVEISSRAAGIRGSTVGYKKGEHITLKELLFGLMLRSGNDASIAISEGVSGSVEEFVKLMNEYAVEIGLSNSHFSVPHGLDDVGHYSTAYDLALITTKAKENKLFNEIVNSKDVDASQYGFTRSYHNINKILWLIPEADGVKTGFTGDAGKCLVTTVKVQGKSIVIVVLNCVERWKETKRIYDYICKNYQYKKYYSKGDVISRINVIGGKNKINLICSKDINLPLKNDGSYEVKFIKPEKIFAPVKKGDRIGSLCFSENGKVIFHEGLEALEDSLKIKAIRRFFF